MYKTLIFSLIAFACPIQASQIQSTFISVPSATLYCQTLGKGKPLVVLHGGPGLSEQYLLPYLYRLAENNFVIFYDQRASGKSTGQISADTINIATFIEDIQAIRKEFNLEKISILGHSWGGFLAMNYAISHPECVEKLILSNSMPASSDEFRLFIQEWIKRTSPYQSEIKSIEETNLYKEGDPETVARVNRIIFRTYCYDPEKANLLQLKETQDASINGKKVYEIFAKEVFHRPFNLHESLQKLQMPTLIVHGDSDPIPPSTTESIHKSISNSQYILMKQCGHFPYVEDPDHYFSVLHEFLAQELKTEVMQNSRTKLQRALCYKDRAEHQILPCNNKKLLDNHSKEHR